MRTLKHPSTESLDLSSVLAALADPVRRQVVTVLADGGDHEISCVDFNLPVSKSTSTHHFRVLRQAGLIRQEYQGTSIMNTLRRADLDARFPGLLDSILGARDGTGADAGQAATESA